MNRQLQVLTATKSDKIFLGEQLHQFLAEAQNFRDLLYLHHQEIYVAGHLRPYQ
jgi:hypothetical protein